MKFIVIIPGLMKAVAEAASKQIDPTSIGEDFVTPLKTIGSIEVTHFASLPNVTDEDAIAAIRQFASSESFIAAGGLCLECHPSKARSEFLALIAENGLEEVPAENE